jgi:adenosylcobyric acid synthase
MTAKALMFMGTGSDVGKSLLVAGFCRALTNRGIRVAPFKPQNMSNNAAVTVDGGEIGRAQALQARAARVEPTVHMNPLLLKPESATGSQVILQGKRVGKMTAREFFTQRQRYLPAILESFEHLKREHDVILVEGAGSPAEVNLRNGDLANMGFARAANVPCILIGDIHRGGVIASIAGTFDLLPPEDRALLKGFIINKFHGDVSLFNDGRKLLEQRTGTPCFGVIPHFENASRLPAEDAVVLEEKTVKHSEKTKICVLRLPRIANFDDIDPLQLEPEVNLIFIHEGEPIPGDARLVIIPGSKSTVADLAALRQAGWDIDLKAHVRRGGHVLGICGGYQMLGRLIHDPNGLEGLPGTVEGLSLLDVETTLLRDKTLTQVKGTHTATSTSITGYEIHLGKTTGPDCKRPFAHIHPTAAHETSSRQDEPDGAISLNGLVSGTYLHGCFGDDTFRSSALKSYGIENSMLRYDHIIEETLDQLAEHVMKHTVDGLI